MSLPAEAPRPTRLPWRLISALIVAFGMALLVAANVHLVYVAFESHPDCVPHAKEPGGEGFRAARSSC